MMRRKENNIPALHRARLRFARFCRFLCVNVLQKQVLAGVLIPALVFAALPLSAHADELPAYLRPELEMLLDLKMNSPEVKEIPRIDILNKYLDRCIADIKNKITDIADSTNDWERLNRLFLHTLETP